jgi:hypothetical protein
LADAPTADRIEWLMAHADQDLATINSAIARAMRELGDNDLPSDRRERLERELAALVDTRLAIERQANRTAD